MGKPPPLFFPLSFNLIQIYTDHNVLPMHIQTLIKALVGMRHGYYGMIYKAIKAANFTDEELCKMTILLVAVLKYRRSRIPGYVVDYVNNLGCLHKYPYLTNIFDVVGVDPNLPIAVGVKADIGGGVGDNKESVG